MKYINIIVFAGLLMFVAGCQQKQQDVSTGKKVQKKAVKQKSARRGPTQLETKKSVSEKKINAEKIVHEKLA